MALSSLAWFGLFVLASAAVWAVLRFNVTRGGPPPAGDHGGHGH